MKISFLQEILRPNNQCPIPIPKATQWYNRFLGSLGKTSGRQNTEETLSLEVGSAALFKSIQAI